MLPIKNKEVELTEKIPVDELISHVEFVPDGKMAIATKFVNHKVAILNVDSDGKITYYKKDLPVGLWPYNVAVSPDGNIALTADNGFSGASDGNVDTVSVIDLKAEPPRVIDKVVVGDGPEGIAISPKGDVAVAVILNGSNSGKKGLLL
ncbi:YncE family protein [Methylobacterium oryzisoli]|uniref:YncE family protein n=1 Tax=Methylobacterium oryzisoli TaxID=3385502 RepID=UPI00389268EF